VSTFYLHSFKNKIIFTFDPCTTDLLQKTAYLFHFILRQIVILKGMHLVNFTFLLIRRVFLLIVVFLISVYFSYLFYAFSCLFSFLIFIKENSDLDSCFEHYFLDDKKVQI
jgi:hypothetical protein